MTAPAAHERPTDGVASTPSVAGYALAVLVSWPLVVLLVWPPSLGPSAVLDPSWWLVVALAGVLLGPVGCFLVHAGCEGIDAQWVHVLAAGAAGAAPMALAAVLESGLWPLVLGAGVATALGRFAVTPLVPVVRLRAPAGASYWRRLSLR